ncbi:MAG: PhoH family protein, partial [Verrucomicrobiota bacterium]
MFLTRLGVNSTCAITGDPTQTDLKPHVRSGLHEAMEALPTVKGVEFCYLAGEDVVRHPVVQRIIGAYQRYRETEPAG